MMSSNKKKHRIGNAVLVCVAFFSLQGTARGQHWTYVTSPADSAIFQTPYFLNENIGFVFNSDGMSPPHLQKTTDGGISWTVLPFFDNRNLSLRQLYFTDSNRGFIAASDGVYETQDMGNSWRKIYACSLPIFSIYAYGKKVVAYCGSKQNSLINWGPLVETNDDGKSWDTVIVQTSFMPVGFQDLMSPCVFGNKDSMIYAAAIDSLEDISIVYSTNNGKDWASNKFDNINSNITMGFFAFPHCKDILRTSLPENDPANQDNYFIMHSSDFGVHWDKLFVPVEIGAWIAGDNCVLYVSDAKGPIDSNTVRNGLWRSQDRGITWQYIHGPEFKEIDDEDFRNLSVIGEGAVVYAGDVRLNLWKTTDGGDGTLSPGGVPSSISIRHDLAPAPTVCDTSILGIYFQNLSCNYTSLKDRKIDGLDSTQFSSLWKHHLACDGIPDTILIRIFAIPAGSSTYKVHLHFVNDEFNAIDTNFDFTLSPNSIPTNILITQKLTPAVFACDTSLFLMRFQSLSCFFTSLKSFNIDGLDSSQFSYILKQHTGTDGVPDSLMMRIFSVPNGGGTYTIHLHFASTRLQTIDTSFVFILSPLSIPAVKFYVHSSSLSGKSGDTIETRLMSNSTQNIVGLTSVDLTYSLNTDLLSPFAFIPAKGVTAGPLTVTRKTATVTLYFDSNFSFSGETELGKLHSVAYVTDTLETDILLVRAIHSSGCLSTFADSNTMQFTLTGCGTSALSHFIKYGTVFDITSIIPNPAGNSVKIKLKNDGTLLNFQLLDALGAPQKSGATGGTLVQLNLSGLSSGDYYFRIIGKDGTAVTKQLVIAK